MKHLLSYLFLLLIVLIPHQNAVAQSCGCASPGPNLIVNGDFEDEALNQNGIPGVFYTWVGAPTFCPNLFGTYSINSSAVKCPGAKGFAMWQSVDHTIGDVATELSNYIPGVPFVKVKTAAQGYVKPRGHFMLVDPATTAGTAYAQTIGVCPNTDYQFSFWAKNIQTSWDDGLKKPTITIAFNGVRITTPPVVLPFIIDYQTHANIEKWTEVKGCWKSGPTDTEVKFSIEMLADGTGGNDLAMDDFVFRRCSQSISTSVLATSPPNCSSCKDISVEVIPANFPLTYSWSPGGETTKKITACPSVDTQYTLTIKGDECGVPFLTTHTINIPASNLKVISNPSLACNGDANGILEVEATGTGPYTYNWLPTGGNKNKAVGLKAGTYSVNVTGPNFCDTKTFEIKEPPPIVINMASLPICPGAQNGIATTTITGGTPDYKYAWSKAGSPTTSTLSGLSAEPYTLTVTDKNSCTKQGVVNVTETPPITVVIPNPTPVCGANGTLTANASGGTAPFTYTWVPTGGNGQVASGLPSGNYTVSVTDVAGCVQSTTSSIATIPGLTITPTQTNASCPGSTDGAISLSINGGTPDFIYTWPNGVSSTTNVATNIPAGVYPITVTDSKGCKETQTVTVTAKPTFTVTVPSYSLACGETATLNSNITGATGNLTYTWLPQGGNASSAPNLPKGTYTVLVADDLSGCTNSATTTVFEPPIPVITSTPNPVKCFGGSDGSITTNVTGGTPVYSYSWSPVSSSATSLSNLPKGDYTLSVTDTKNCTTTQTITITEPPALDLTVPSVTIACGTKGTLTPNLSGGTPIYNYTWTPTGGNNKDATGLEVGIYSLNVSDANGCLITTTAAVVNPPTMTVVPTQTNVTCFGGNDGAANLNVTGGQAPFDYTWTKGTSTTDLNTGLTSGTVALTVKDANQCVVVNVFDITEPPPIVIVPSATPVKCYQETNGSVTANVSGGVPQYTLNWMPGASSATGMQDLAAGVYSIEVIDSKGCVNTETVLVSEPPPIVSTMAFNNPKCFGLTGDATIDATGGTAPLNYSWNTNPVQTSSNATGVLPGNYEVTITDANGCVGTNSVTLVEPPAPPKVVANTDGDTKCRPANIAFTDNSNSNNPNDPITEWLWTFADGTTSTLQNPVHSFTNAGNFGVTLQVKTQNGCGNSNSTKPVNIVVLESPIANFSASPTKMKSRNDEIVITNKSTGAKSYDWDFGDGKKSNTPSPKHLYKAIGVYDIELVARGSNGCTDTATVRIEPFDAIVEWPWAFTPNTNGPSGGWYDSESLENDIFFPWSFGIVKYKLQVFNRWGELIFETENWKQGWDGYYRGELCQHDVYVFKAFVQLSTGKIVNKVGDVTLLR